MSFFLFVDESGQDRKDSPYQVLGGITIEDRDLWNLVCAVHDLEERTFGMRISDGLLELKGKKLLKSKTFKHAQQLQAIPDEKRKELTRSCLQKGEMSKGMSKNNVTREELTALAQSKIHYVESILELALRYKVKAFASIVDRDAEYPLENDFLRKDYSYLFERYYYYLNEAPEQSMGVIVFDELEKSESYILIDQMSYYFKKTGPGRQRASRIIPEPFFVHSHLTTAIQLADLVVYIISWGVRLPGMIRDVRSGFERLCELVLELRFRSQIAAEDGTSYPLWSFKYLDDLRPAHERP